MESPGTGLHHQWSLAGRGCGGLFGRSADCIHKAYVPLVPSRLCNLTCSTRTSSTTTTGSDSQVSVRGKYVSHVHGVQWMLNPDKLLTRYPTGSEKEAG